MANRDKAEFMKRFESLPEVEQYGKIIDRVQHQKFMEFVGDRLAAKGYKILKGAADHIAFKAGKAYSILDGNECELDGIFRYTFKIFF